MVWSTSTSPETSDNKVVEGGTTIGVFTAVSITGLSANTTYYVRPCATNGNGDVGYGAEINFTTSALPTLATTTNPTSVTSSGATCGGNITAAPCSITERGLAYHTSTSPEITDNKVIEGGTTTGAFTANITGLPEGTKYYVRAYATTAAGTSYGAETWFYTGYVPTLVGTSPAINIFCESFSTGIIGDPVYTYGRAGRSKPEPDAVGDLYVAAQEYGIIYGVNSTDVTNSEPGALVGASVKDAHIANNALSLNQGSRFQEITGLTASTTYYFKAYITNGVGSGYGAVDNFTTSAACAEFYSCSGINTYHTDASCATAVATPTASSILYYRHDWSDDIGTEMADLNEITSMTFVTAKPYRIVMESGGYIYTDNAYNAGTQVVVNVGGQFGFSGSPAMIVDGLTTPGQKFARLTMNGGSFVSTGSMINSLKIEAGNGELCNDGSFTNQFLAPGSVYGNYALEGGLTATGAYTDAKCVGTFTVLPVELLSFNAILTRENQVNLSWVTGSEINNDYFEVLSSVDGKTWEYVTVINGAGNSYAVNKYSFVDYDIEGYEKKYYKLKQVDLDGAYSYSKIEAVGFSVNGGITHAYNDGKSLHVFVEGIEVVTELLVLNTNAQYLAKSEVLVQGKQNEQLTIKIENLIPGIYFINLKNGSRSYSYKLFLK